MNKTISTAFLAAPTAVASASLADDVLRNLRVIDAATGETIARVIDADSVAGTLTRYEVKDGNLVREGDTFKIVTETRPIQIQWINPPAAPGIADDADPAGSDDRDVEPGDA